jgi:hypothetical protein
MNNGYGRTSWVTALAVALSLASTVAAAAQETDGRWTAFYGCWEPVDETVDRGVLCVRPEAGGVELYTVVDGIITTSDAIVADGGRNETSVEGCEGWESATFSDDGRRVFTSSEFVCGEETPRSATGVMSLVAPTRWIDVRSVDVDGEKVAWVQHYQLVGPERLAEEGIEDITADIGMAVRTARMAASQSIGINDVEEATALMDAKAVETWIAARGERFDIDADELIRMADAGIPENVIDVVVAVSYPEIFTVNGGSEMQERPMARGARAGVFGDAYGLGIRTGGRGYGVRSAFWDPFYYGYSPYRSSMGYGYGNSSGYGYGNGYGSYGMPYGGYYYRPITVVVEPRTPEDRARVVNGRGYSRPGGGSSSGAGSSPRSGASSSPPRSSGGSTGAASSGGSSTAKPRTAKPRGGR